VNSNVNGTKISEKNEEEVYFYLKTATIRNITGIYGIYVYIYLACLRFLIHENRVLHFFEKLVLSLFCKFQSYYYS